MVDDAELLLQYSKSGSEAAFTELVRRHLTLVYFTAVRRTGGDTALAQDVAQSVFSTAARKARDLSGHLTVAGWLYTTTRNLADKAARKERTRRRYERDAAMHELTTANPSHEWERLKPIIDDALNVLEDSDREAILIRFFEGGTFAETGETLRISEDAARMRVQRALEKLRKKLHRRGIESAAGALALALSTQASVAVPAAMVTAVSGAAMATAAAASGTVVLLGFMSISKTTAVAATVAAVFATGFGIIERNRARSGENRLSAVAEEQASLRARLAVAEKRVSQAQSRADEADEDSVTLLAAVEAARKQRLTRTPAAAAQTIHNPDDPLAHSLHALFPDGIVATVGDKTIMVEEIRRELTPHLPKLKVEARDADEFSHRLNKLQNTAIKDAVERILLVKEFANGKANEAPREVAPSSVDQAIADILKEQFAGDSAKFAAFLESRSVTPEQYRKELEETIAYNYMRNQQRKIDKRAKEKTN